MRHGSKRLMANDLERVYQVLMSCSDFFLPYYVILSVKKLLRGDINDKAFAPLPETKLFSFSPTLLRKKLIRSTWPMTFFIFVAPQFQIICECTAWIQHMCSSFKLGDIWDTLTNYGAYSMTLFDILACFMLFLAPRDVSISHALDREISNELWSMVGKQTSALITCMLLSLPSSK